MPSDIISRVTSYDYAGSFLLMPVGTVIAGPLAAGFGLRGAMIATSVASVVLIFSTLGLREVRQLRSQPAPDDIVSS